MLKKKNKRETYTSGSDGVVYMRQISSLGRAMTARYN